VSRQLRHRKRFTRRCDEVVADDFPFKLARTEESHSGLPLFGGVIVTIRKYALLPLDDCLYALQATMPSDALVGTSLPAKACSTQLNSGLPT
jgi:hypothetical protein